VTDSLAICWLYFASIIHQSHVAQQVGAALGFLWKHNPAAAAAAAPAATVGNANCKMLRLPFSSNAQPSQKIRMLVKLPSPQQQSSVRTSVAPALDMHHAQETLQETAVQLKIIQRKCNTSSRGMAMSKDGPRPPLGGGGHVGFGLPVSVINLTSSEV
jgi:hypothetical protein